MQLQKLGTKKKQLQHADWPDGLADLVLIGFGEINQCFVAILYRVWTIPLFLPSSHQGE